MSLPRFSISQPVLVNLLMLLILTAGIIAFISMSKEEWPDVPINTIRIETAYSGASPQEMETLVTRPIEDEVVDLEDVDSVTSFSMEGRSVVNVNLVQEIDDIYRKLQEVQNAVNKVDDLPPEADDPEVERAQVPFRIITIGLVGEGVEAQLRQIADDLAYDVKGIYGVDDVELLGARDREIWVEVDPLRLQAYGLSMSAVMRALAARNLNIPGGTLKQGRQEYIVRTVGEFVSVAQVGDVIVGGSRSGGVVYVRDIARVRDTFEEPELIARVNGRRGIMLIVQQDNCGKIVDIVRQIRAVVARYRERLPAGATIEFAHDNSRNLARRLGILYSNGLSGFLLVLISLFVCIGARPALMTALGMPVAFCGCILLMDLSGITINSLSLFAMIIVLGMIVDDAIIVTENVYRHIESGMPVRDAVVLGTQQVMWPVVAAVTTTVAAFLPMLLMTGAIGKVMSIVPQVVVFALLASLWEAFMLLPSHLADFGRPPVAGATSRRQALISRLQAWYGAVLRRALQRRYLVVCGTAAASLVIFVTAFGTLDFVLFPRQDFESIQIRMQVPANMRIEQTDRLAQRVEQLVQQLPAGEVVACTATVGRQRANMGNREGGWDFGSHLVEMEVRLCDSQLRQRSGETILEDIRSRLRRLEHPEWYAVRKVGIGPPVGRPVAVRVMGDDFSVLQRITQRVRAELSAIAGVTQVQDDFTPGKDELRVQVDTQRASLFGLTVQDVAQALQFGYMGGVATDFRDRNDEYDLVVRYAPDYRTAVDDVAAVKIPIPSGGHVLLSDVARVVRTPGYGKIRRFDQRRVINITAEILEGQNNTRDVVAALRDRLGDFMRRFPGAELSFGGEYEDTQRSLASLFRAFGLALFLIYTILATVFKSYLQPCMVMLSIPFALLGVLIGLIVTRTPMGMMSFMGVIALAGIVVNDAIVLIDFVNRRRRETDLAAGRLTPIIEACKMRLRPIVLTQVTTILGLLPLALGLFGREMLMTPMAIAIVWGLVFSSVLTLMIIPCFYMIIDDIRGVFPRTGTTTAAQHAGS